MCSPESSNPIKAVPSPTDRKLAVPLFPQGWCTYVLICIDGSYYVGMTNDLAQRIYDHANGKGPIYTKTTKPRLLVWFESHPHREVGAAREKQLKGWSRAKKQVLARGASPSFCFGSRPWISL